MIDPDIELMLINNCRESFWNAICQTYFWNKKKTKEKGKPKKEKSPDTARKMAFNCVSVEKKRIQTI